MTVRCTQRSQPAPDTEPYPKAKTLVQMRYNLDQVRQRMASACARSGRDPGSVRLLPVSKTVDEARIRLAYQAGCRLLGENKVQEALGKTQILSDLPDLQWSVIGHLQTNKAKHVARFATEFQALDSLRLAEVLDRRLQLEGRGLDVFVQVNSSGEDSKYGLPPQDTAAFIRALSSYSALRVRGLMTLAIFSDDSARVRPCFARLRQLRDQLRQDASANVALDELSMGMSGDYELAIEEGATVVRVGQAIFGARHLPDAYYWPSSDSAQAIATSAKWPTLSPTPAVKKECH
ncbi:YggS family pyridoxal phosphate-dependent enzyme [Marinobacter sp. CA1]|uniref:YggS family pyridoxal phosphate-dependent enzyme n=1 Tax=Marinobacter sp. CA1 TaxID=2817656 RepID=UPI001D065A94|nr:YggS family pyridoxal phosphate-dependent enzyme [Marinobacter sp. CA1]UDL06941.1 YggS family pyridoxal phosphate-dependent enzyme [Marinobacter sp. CA1]